MPWYFLLLAFAGMNEAQDAAARLGATLVAYRAS